MKRLIIGIVFCGFLFVQVFAQAIIIAPNGGESWARDSRQWIRWELVGSPDNIPVRLVLFFSSGRRAGRIGARFNLHDRSFQWQTGLLDTGTAPAGNYIVRLERLLDGSLIDASDAPFSISIPTTYTYRIPGVSARSFRLASPNGGEIVDAGTTLPIRWTALGYSGVPVGVFVGSATTSTMLASDLPIERGRYDWDVHRLTCGVFRATVRSQDGGLQDSSDRDFKIIPATRLTVLLPNGGERYRRGEAMEIRWRADDPILEHAQEVGIFIMKFTSALRRPEDGIDIGFAVVPLSSGEYHFRIPNDAPASDFYSVHIQLHSSLYRQRGIVGFMHDDVSNDCFRIE